MLLQKLYPLSNHPEPRFTLDTDAALGNTDIPLQENYSVVELLSLADGQLTEAGFKKSGGSAYTKGDKCTVIYQEVNFLQPFNAPSQAGKIQAAHIPMAIEEGTVRQLDSLAELKHALDVSPLKIRVSFPALSQEVSVCIPPLEQAVILKTFAVKGRGYLDKDLKDLLMLLRIRKNYPDLTWRLDEKSLIGTRRDAAYTLHQISKYLRTRTIDGLEHQEKNELRQLIAELVIAPTE